MMVNLTKYNLSNKTAIVTGAAGILGRQFCHTLAEAGANIVLVDVNATFVDEAVLEISSTYPNAKLLPKVCDVTDSQQVADMMMQISDVFPEINILINNAATKTNDLKKFFAPFEDYSIDTWREVMSVNLEGMFIVAQAVGKQMLHQNKGGSIIQVASIYGVVAPDQRIYEDSEYLGVSINTPVIYSVSKAGVIGLTKYLAAYWGKQEIRVNTLTPGGVASGQNETFHQKYSYRVPLNRMATKDEISDAMLFLASDASKYITGQNIVVDGGLTCW